MSVIELLVRAASSRGIAVGGGCGTALIVVVVLLLVLDLILQLRRRSFPFVGLLQLFFRFSTPSFTASFVVGEGESVAVVVVPAWWPQGLWTIRMYQTIACPCVCTDNGLFGEFSMRPNAGFIDDGRLFGHDITQPRRVRLSLRRLFPLPTNCERAVGCGDGCGGRSLGPHVVPQAQIPTVHIEPILRGCSSSYFQIATETEGGLPTPKRPASFS